MNGMRQIGLFRDFTSICSYRLHCQENPVWPKKVIKKYDPKKNGQ